MQESSATIENRLTTDQQVALHAKLARIQGKLGFVGKSGKNLHSNYDYAKEEDFLAAIGPLLAEEQVSTLVSCIQHEVKTIETSENDKKKRKLTAVVVIELVITCATSGQSVALTMPGYAEDTGDKALYKAITGATKYAYWKAFRIATGDDPEKDHDQPLTEAEAQKLVSACKKNGYSLEDLKAYAGSLPAKEITRATLAAAEKHFSEKKPV